MCDKAKFQEMDSELDALTQRVATLEDRVADLHKETLDGFATTTSAFAAVNANIETLSQQITNMDRRIIEEKVKWGDVTRSIVKWTVRTILIIVAYAAGVNLTKTIIGSIMGGN